MKNIFIVRTMIVLYVVLYILSSLFHYTIKVPAEAKEYQETLIALFGGFRSDLFICNIFWILGHLIEFLGLVLIFFRRTYGVWLAIIGGAIVVIASYSVANPDSYPVLQTPTNSLLWGATCITWGAIISMAFVIRSEDRSE